MSEQDVDKLKKLVKALDDMVEAGEAILADGKLDFSDAMHLPKFVPVLQDLYSLWSDKDEMLEELKDLQWEEVKELIEAAKG